MTDERTVVTVDRRATLTAVGTALLGSTGGCSLLGGSSGDSRAGGAGTGAGGGSPEPLSGEWETTTEGDAAARVVSDGLSDATLEFRVYRCAEAYADATLGTVEDTLTIGFTYTTRAENWWEVPYFGVREDGDVTYSSRDDSETTIGHERATERSGGASTTVEVDGETTVRFGIMPSRNCGNSNHENTYFTVDDLTVERV